MNCYYECQRCLYKTNKLSNMKTHLNRIKKCPLSSLELFNYSDEEFYNNSLIKKYIKKNNEDNENKKFKCKNCNMNFTRNSSLKRHILESCKCKNNINTNNNTDNNIINIDFVNSFEDNWNTNHIDINEKYKILQNKYIYKEILEKILENDNNLNVLIDGKNGCVFDNTLYVFDIIKIVDLVTITIKRINETIHNFCEEIKNSNIEKDYDIINNSLNYTNTVYNNYMLKKDNTHNKAKNMIINIYNNKRLKTYNILEKIIKNNYEYIDNIFLANEKNICQNE